jgi:hypothetical protein
MDWSYQNALLMQNMAHQQDLHRGGLMAKTTEVNAEKKPKKEGPKFEGMALEMDVIKKMAHQIDRLEKGSDARSRVIEYMARVVAEEKVAVVKTIDKNGQPELFP